MALQFLATTVLTINAAQTDKNVSKVRHRHRYDSRVCARTLTVHKNELPACIRISLCLTKHTVDGHRAQIEKQKGKGSESKHTISMDGEVKTGLFWWNAAEIGSAEWEAID